MTSPPVEKQKRYIIENAGLLNRKVRLDILGILKSSLDPDGIGDAVFEKTERTDIDLDAVGRQCPDALTQIYNLVRSRIEALSHSAQGRPT